MRDSSRERAASQQKPLCGKQPGKKGEAGSRLRARPCKVRRTLCSRRCEQTPGSFTATCKEQVLASGERLAYRVSASQKQESVGTGQGALKNFTQRSGVTRFVL